jgi:serine/threonine-protein kinase
VTDAPSRCAACQWPLGADDLYCPRCGTPTPKNVDPDATLVNPPEAADEATAVAVPTGNFKDRLRHVLGAEYDLLAVIGQGGFARVYRARDKRLGRDVALKVIRPDVLGKHAFVESFRNEGVALAKLRHPAIVPIYDIRERGGLIFYIMPFVQGTTLDARMEKGRLPPFETRRILSELADALAAAHRAQMVHLDIKPANVFLEGDMQKVLLMDFGIAKALTGPADEVGAAVVGTPEYMSPEQARGLPEIDHRSDIYSLGALGYRMLIGRPPFTGRNAKEVLEKHVTTPPVPLREINQTIPKDFADAIMRCLKKEPAERFATALELRAALDSVTFAATRDSAASAAPAGPQGTRMTLIAAAVFLVGVVVGLLIG